MIDCLLYAIRPEPAPTELESWAALEAKSETMAADLVRQSLAGQSKLRRTRQRTILVAAAVASAIAAFLLR